jgi:hypothetical protein
VPSFYLSACIYACSQLRWPAGLSVDRPVNQLLESLRRMGQFRGRDATCIWELLPGSATPWHYVPVWVAITTPWPLHLLLAAGGLGYRCGCRPRQGTISNAHRAV